MINQDSQINKSSLQKAVTYLDGAVYVYDSSHDELTVSVRKHISLNQIKSDLLDISYNENAQPAVIRAHNFLALNKQAQYAELLHFDAHSCLILSEIRDKLINKKSDSND